jgi:hypothetical protein
MLFHIILIRLGGFGWFIVIAAGCSNVRYFCCFAVKKKR